MSTASSVNPTASRRRQLVWLTLAAIGIIVIVVAAVTWLGGGSQERTVGDLLDSSGEIHPVEATSELCDEPDCVEGWSTDVGDYLRFDSVGEAEYWATVLGDDGRRWQNIVLDLGDNDVSQDQRRYAIDVLFTWHDWS